MIIVVLVIALVSCASTTPNKNNIDVMHGLAKISEPNQEFKCAAEQNGVSLWYCEKDAEIQIKKNDTSYIGVYKKSDLNFEGAAALKVQSHLTISYANDNNIVQTTSKVSSINTKTYSVQEINNGVKFIFDFSKEKERFIIPIEYVLEKGTLKATICTDEIVEYGENKLISLSLLPALVSGFPDEEGNIILPDGIGAEVDFKVQPNVASTISMEVYGRDPALSTSRHLAEQQVCRLPVYGCTKDTSAILAIIEGGSSLATIKFEPSTETNPMAVCYPEFRYRTSDTVTLADQSFKSKIATMISENHEKKSFSVRYFFIDEKSDFTDLAFIYRDYLLSKKKNTTQANPSIYIEVFGSVKEKDSFLGITYDRSVAVTTFEQLSEISDLLEGNKLTFLLQGFGVGGYGKLTKKLTAANICGGEKGLLDFKNKIGKDGEIYFGTQVMLDNKTSVFGDYAGNVFSQTITKNNFSLSLGTPLKTEEKPYFKSFKVEKNLNTLISKLGKTQYDGIYFNDVGSIVYSNYSENDYESREAAIDRQIKVLDKYSKNNGKTIVSSANAYAVPYVTTITNVSVNSSCFINGAKEIPFLPLALSGVVEMVSEPINTNGNNFLKAISYGMGIQFSLTGIDNFSLKETELAFLNGTEVNRLTEDIIDYADRFKKVSGAIKNSKIIGYKSLEDGVYKVEYDNGVVLITNVTEDDVLINNELIKAKTVNIE